MEMRKEKGQTKIFLSYRLQNQADPEKSLQISPIILNTFASK